MIGNDVVDLATARVESNWKRKGFLDKLFTKNEQAVIKSSSDPEVMVWILWSMKEAAYKVYNRQTGIRAFIPHHFQSIVSKEGKGYAGRVIWGETVYFTKSTCDGDLIHTIAVLKPEDISNTYLIKNREICKDEEGRPYLRVDDNEAEGVISRSHHGKYVINVGLG